MADSMWSQVSSRCLLAPSRIGCANNVIHSPTASSVQPMETIHCSTFCNIGMRLPAPILLLVRGRDFLYTVRRVKEDQQKNGQRPWESWPEAVGILARGRASPGQRPCAGYLSWPKPVRTSSWRPGQRRCAGQDPACWSLLIVSPLLVFVYDTRRCKLSSSPRCARTTQRCERSPPACFAG